MNRVAIIEQAGNPRFDIVVDGRRLAEHFAGRQGSHPVQVIPIGWKDADCRYEQETLEQLLRCIFGHQGRVRGDQCPFFITHIAGVRLALHPLNLPQSKFITGSSGPYEKFFNIVVDDQEGL